DDVNNGISVKNTGEVIKIMEIDGSYNSQIEEGQEVIWNIYAPVGWSVVDVSDIRIWISKPSGSQGYHRIQFNRIVLESGGGLGTYSLDSGNVSGDILFNLGKFHHSEPLYPVDGTDYANLLNSLVFDDETPVQARYTNGLNLPQTYKLDIKLKCTMKKKVEL